jgi:filamentous hemagglutinin
VTSQSSQKTTLEGTQIESGGSTTIEAGSLDAKAAKNTTRKSESSEYTEAAFRGEVDVSGTPGATISGGYGQSSTGSSSSTAVTGGIKSGGDVTVKTTGDTRLEGTRVQSKGDTTIDAGGNVILDAARNKEQSDSSSLDVSGSVSAAKGSAGGSFSYETSESHSRSDQAVTGSVEAGSNLTVKSGKDVKVEGADLSAGKNATVSADGKVEMKDAVSTSQSESESVSVSGTAEVSGGGKSKGNRRTKTKDGDMPIGGGGGSYESTSTSETTTKQSTIKAGGEVKVTPAAPAPGSKPK